jgi:hypothetical protein
MKLKDKLDTFEKEFFDYDISTERAKPIVDYVKDRVLQNPSEQNRIWPSEVLSHLKETKQEADLNLVWDTLLNLTHSKWHFLSFGLVFMESFEQGTEPIDIPSNAFLEANDKGYLVHPTTGKHIENYHEKTALYFYPTEYFLTGKIN